MLLRLVVLMLAAVLVIPSAAAAHVELTPDQVAPSSFTLFTVLSPNESEQPLTGLRLSIPNGMTVEGAADTPGFTTRPIFDSRHRLSTLSWTGGSVPPDGLALFRFSASVGAATGTLQLVGVQTFADGSTKTWNTPELAVAEDSQSDTTARALGFVGIGMAAAALAAAGAGLWWRRSR
jgi:hypothetical protein